MPYGSRYSNYQAGDYYRGGDFLGIGKALKKFQPLKALGNVIRATPIGSALLPRTSMPSIMPQIPVVNEPGLPGLIHRIVPGGNTGLMVAPGYGVSGHRHRRVNVANVRALRRATRRVKGFLKLATRLGAIGGRIGHGKKLFKPHARKHK